ncbi:acyltransferase 3 [Lucifera butyrica]|uniref:Acyltransferase 3 n=2 Tax=Lucifera butyrica TaxID=1351585 RepID=A0A498RI06_9FIRM|nr:acyltransferase 3 [Lucifera butyrica]
MAKQRITAIEYIRGIAMLGVIGIHTGAYSLSNPAINIHLFALLEIASRFSVPVFFFVSAFGLFFKQNLYSGFNYADFLRRRFKTVLIPYVVWSYIYMLHAAWVSGDPTVWSLAATGEYLLFGLASYQLYFLVILLWFYLLMPLWRQMIRIILNHPVRYLSIIFFCQVAFNYYSSYRLEANFTNYYLNLAIQYRLSYLFLHYLFIFLFGGVCALEYNRFQILVIRYKRPILAFFLIALCGMLAHYYYLLFIDHYSLEEAVNIAHQLSPIGVLYTLAAALFWYMLFSLSPLPAVCTAVLHSLGEYSYPIYLVHPLVMYYLSAFLTHNGFIMTNTVTMIFYLTAVVFSLAFGIWLKKAGNYLPWLSLLLIGRRQPVKLKSET